MSPLSIPQKAFPKFGRSHFTEHVSAKRVKYFIDNYGDNYDDDTKTSMNNYLKAIKKGVVKCTYNYGSLCKQYNIGRMYSPLSLQPMPNLFRAFVVDKKYHDIDIVNCNPTILLQLFKSNDYDCTYLQKYVDNRDKYLEKYAKKYNVDKKVIKKGMNAIIFGKSIKTLEQEFNATIDSKFIFKFVTEVRQNCKSLIKNEHYKGIVDDINSYLQIKGKQVGYMPSIISHMVATVERNVLAVIVGFFLEEKFEVSTLIFDGCHVQSDKNIDEGMLRMCEKVILEKTGFDIKLTEKHLEHDIEYKEEEEKEEILGIEPVEINPETDEFDARRSNITYENQKLLFEKNHFKVLTPTMFFKSFINEKEECELKCFKTWRDTYQDVKYTELIIDKKTERKTWTTSSFIKRWLDDNNKRQYEKIIFNPDPDYVNNERFYNMFRGFKWTRENSTPNPENIEPLLSHLLHTICGGNQEECDYLLNWMAFAIQKPHIKTKVAVVLQGLQGAGKGTIVDYLASIVGKQYYTHPTSQNDVLGNFNSILAGKTLVFMDEITWGGNKHDSGALKKLITEPTMSINEKNTPQYEIDNFANYFIASNSSWVVPSQKGGRRFFIPSISNYILMNLSPEERTAYFNKIRTVKAEHWAYYLYNRDISNFIPTEIKNTKKQYEQEEYSYTKLEKWWADVLHEGVIRINDYERKVDDTTEIPKHEVFEAFMTSQFRDKHMSNINFWTELKKLVNVKTIQKRVNGKVIRVVTFDTLDNMEHQYRVAMMNPEFKIHKS